MGFLKRLLGLEKSAQPKKVASSSDGKTAPEEATFVRSARSRAATNRYFEFMGTMQGAIAARKYDEAAQIIGQTLDVLEPWLKEDKCEFDRFLIGSIPVFEQGGRILAFLGRDAELAKMATIIERHVEFEPWRETVAEHRADQGRFARILDIVSQQPGTLQTDMKQLLGEEDGRHVAILIGFLEKAGRIDRQKSGKTYKLVPAGTKIDAAGELTARSGLPQAPATSHRRGKSAPKPRAINFADLERIPLPHSPVRWEVQQQATETIAPPKDDFETRDADWRLLSIERLPPAARPDPAFRQLYPLGTGMLLVDDLGKSEAFSEAPAAVQLYGADGELKQTVALTVSDSATPFRFSIDLCAGV
jgi:hypothetical protein